MPKRHGCPVFIGLDSNAVLGDFQNIHNVDRTIMGKYLTGKRDRHGDILYNWLVENNLVVSSSFLLDSNSNMLTRYPDCNTNNQVPKQIDYIFSDRVTHKRLTDTYVNDNIRQIMSSDHSLVSCIFDFKKEIKLAQHVPIRKSKPIGWQPFDAEAFADDVQCAVSALNEVNDAADEDNITELVVNIAEHHALKQPYIVHNRPNSNIKDSELRILLDQRGVAKTKIEKTRIHKLIRKRRTYLKYRKQRERFQKDMENCDSKGIVKPIYRSYGTKCTQNGSLNLFKPSDNKFLETPVITVDNNKFENYARGATEVGELFTDYYSEFYYDPCFQPPDYLVNGYSDNDLSALAGPAFSTVAVTMGIQALRKNKSCSDDNLVAEMLQLSYSEELVSCISDIFTKRVINLININDVWSQVSVVLIPKLHNPTFVSDFRPITIIGTLCKLYFRCIA